MSKILKKINLTPKQVLNIFLIIFLLIFIVQNLEVVKVKFLFFGFDLPLIILIVLIFFSGFFTAHVFNKRNNKRSEEQKEIDFDKNKYWKSREDSSQSGK